MRATTGRATEVGARRSSWMVRNSKSWAVSTLPSMVVARNMAIGSNPIPK